MNETLLGLTSQLSYLFSHLTIANIIDMALVAILFFIVFQALYQTRSLQLLRGVIIAAILGVGLLVLLPLNTLNWIVRLALIAGAIALPILFQDELRRVLVGLGQFGSWRSSISSFERFKQSLVSGLNQLSLHHTGALIVLEGQTLLEDVVATGVRMQAAVITSELLQTIFSPRTPLHDGAVIFRGGRLEAASCILPVQTEDLGNSQLGTRHRAALGLSVKVSDALVIIISEETGWISVAYAGRLYLDITQEQLEGWIDRFAEHLEHSGKSRWGWLRGGGLRQTMVNIFTSILLAMICWLIVVYQTNPPDQIALQGVPLTVDGLTQGILVMSDIPEAVNVQIQTTKDRISDMSSASVRAVLDLTGLPPGVHSLPIDVIPADPSVQTISVKPRSLDVTLEEEISRPITPTIVLTDLSSLPPGYVAGDVSLNPAVVTAVGPRSLIDRVAAARLEIAIEDRRADFQETVAPSLIDENGDFIDGLTLVPEQVMATVPIRRTFFSQDVGIQVILDRNGFSPDYEVKEISVDPATVGLAGPQKVLDAVGSYLETAPVSLADQTSDLTVDAPLEVPDGITVLNDKGETIRSVQVKISIVPVTSYLVVQRQVQITGIEPNQAITLTPSEVSVLLIGPKYLLEDLASKPELILVTVSVSGLVPGVYTLPLEISAPVGIETQGFPKEIQALVESG